MGELHWKTGITKVEPNKLLVRGYKLNELIGKITFPQAIYLILTGNLPDANTGKMMDALLVSSIDHGATPPSTLAARTIASTGATINTALAGGILSINKYHGGAIEPAMRQFLELGTSINNEDEISVKVYNYVKQKRENKKIIFGYGHRVHTNDPRTKKIISISKELGFYRNYLKIAVEIEKVIEKVYGKHLPLNVDGTIAAVLCELNIPPEIGNTFFIMARIPGQIAHIYEEITREKPVRKIHPTDHEYDGPPEREIT